MEQSDLESKINCMLLNDNNQDEPSLTANGVKFFRSGKCHKLPETVSHQYSTTKLERWLIIDESLIAIINDGKVHNFNSDENYLIKWAYKLSDPEPQDELDGHGCLFFYWSGIRAKKGFSPLPEETEDEPCIIRIVQWAEPFLFLSLFGGRMIVHFDRTGSGHAHECSVNATATSRISITDGTGKFLYHHYGELENEGRLYSVPCCPCSLRSRTSFVLIDKEERSLKLWHGKISSKRKRDLITLFANDLLVNESGRFKIEETNDQEIIDSSSLDPDFTPRLFYCTQDFIVEVENINRSSISVTPYPFLQSHLYTYSNEAAFIFDTGALVWLWFRKSEGSEEWELYLKCTASAYSRRKNYERECKTAYFKSEPPEFINLFPYWNHL